METKSDIIRKLEVKIVKKERKLLRLHMKLKHLKES